jgi:hypothetical protein
MFFSNTGYKNSVKKYKHTRNWKRNQTWRLPDEYMDKTQNTLIQQHLSTYIDNTE